MNTDHNKQITTEKYLSFLKQQKDFLESQMAARFGMKLYKSVLLKRKFMSMQAQRIVLQY